MVVDGTYYGNMAPTKINKVLKKYGGGAAAAGDTETTPDD